MSAHDAMRAPAEQYCAVHLATLMAGGLRGLNSSQVCAVPTAACATCVMVMFAPFDRHHFHPPPVQAPAVAVEYQSLPDSVMTVVAPLFGITVSEADAAKMTAAGATYSKVHVALRCVASGYTATIGRTQ